MRAEVLHNDSTFPGLVKDARNGDRVAWNTIYNHYYPRLYATALPICNNMALAQDTVQETFLTAYLKLHQLKDTAAFGGWIKKILVHACYRTIKKGPFHEVLGELPLCPESGWEDEVGRKLDLVSTNDQLLTIISGLPEILRITLLLRYFSAFQSYGEIACILNIPLGTVRSRLNEARSKLTASWNQYSDVDSRISDHAQSWDHFYYNTLSSMHRQDTSKKEFFSHFHKDVQIISPGGQEVHDARFFEGMICEDREVGSWLSPVNIISNGNISIVEARHFNSTDHPDHCPPASVMIIYRKKEQVTRIRLQVFK